MCKRASILGTIGSLKFVSQFHNDVILVMNSDLFTNINYEDFYLHFIEHNADMSVACVPYTVPIPYGIFELEGRIIKGIQEKPTYHFTRMQVYILSRKTYSLKSQKISFLMQQILLRLL